MQGLKGRLPHANMTNDLKGRLPHANMTNDESDCEVVMCVREMKWNL